MRPRIMLVALAALSLVAFSFGSTAVLAQGGHVSQEEVAAHKLEQEVAAKIAGAVSKGVDVSEAEKHKAEGDSALKKGDLGVATQHYEAAKKALSGK